VSNLIAIANLENIGNKDESINDVKSQKWCFWRLIRPCAHLAETEAKSDWGEDLESKLCINN
jgi:hypothetical protein